MSYANLDQYAAHVRTETSSMLAGMCRELGSDHPLTLRVLDLCTEATGLVEQNKMREEQSGEYDLAALVAVVNPDTPSSSETFWERED